MSIQAAVYKDASFSIIDMHVHVFPERMFEAIWAYFESANWSVHRQYADAIEKTLSSHGVMAAAALSYPHKTGIAGPLNIFMESLGRDHPFFLPFASVHPDDSDFREYVDRALRSPHIHGFKFQPLVQCFDINDARLDYLYGGCIENAKPLVMHVGTAPIANDFVGVGHFSRLMKRFPDLRVCVAHMGAFEIEDFLAMMDDYPDIWLDTAMINTTTTLFDNSWCIDPAELARKKSRICFGSDWPNVPYDYEEALASLDRFPIAARDLAFENAKRFLKLDLP